MHILHAKKHVKLLLHNHDRSHLSFHGEKMINAGNLQTNRYATAIKVCLLLSTGAGMDTKD